MAPNRAALLPDDDANAPNPESDPDSSSPSASDFCVMPVLKRGPEPGPSPSKRRKTGSNVSGEEEDTKKGRVWSEEGEVAILQGMIDFKADKGADPWTNKTEFHEFLLGRLNADFTKRQVSDKVRRLKHKYYNSDGGDEVAFARGHDMKLVELCKRIWGCVEASNINGGDNGVGSSSSSKKKSRKSKAEDDMVCTVLALPAGKREKSALEKKEKKKKKKKKKAGVDVGNGGYVNVDDVVGNGGDVNVDDVVENGGGVNVDDVVENGGGVNVDDVVENDGDVNVDDVVENDGDASDDKEERFWSRYPFLRDSVEPGKRGSMEDHFMRFLPLVGDSNAKMLDARWRELQLLEANLISKKLALCQMQNDLIGDALKSRKR